MGGYEIKDIQRNYIIVSKEGEKMIISYVLDTSKNLSTSVNPQNVSELSKKEIERLTKDPGVLFQEIRLRPVIEGNRTKGFAFEWIKPGSIFEKSGIKQGDILLSINNIEIKSGEDAFRILQTLRNEPSLKVSLLRGGQNLDITLRID